MEFSWFSLKFGSSSPFLSASNLFLGLQIQQAFRVQAVTAVGDLGPFGRHSPRYAVIQTWRHWQKKAFGWHAGADKVIDAIDSTTRFQPHLKERVVSPKWVSFLWTIAHYFIFNVISHICIFWSSRPSLWLTSTFWCGQKPWPGPMSRSWAGTPANWETSCDG